MPRGSKPGEHRGGRVKGTLNKKTIARQIEADRLLQQQKVDNKPLAIDGLAWLAEILQQGVEYFRPRRFGGFKGERERQYLRWAGELRRVLQELAPYQSPQFRAIVLSATPTPAERHDASAAERLISFFDGLAEQRAYERRQKRQLRSLKLIESSADARSRAGKPINGKP
jgi:hypothetical protein